MGAFAVMSTFSTVIILIRVVNFSVLIVSLKMPLHEDISKHSYLEGKSGVSGGVSKSPLLVTLDSSVAERPLKGNFTL